jgi:hypothetical protein
MKLEFAQQIFKKAQISSLTKIRSVGAQLFHAGGQTDRQINMTKLTVASCSFANMSKNSWKYLTIIMSR